MLPSLLAVPSLSGLQGMEKRSAWVVAPSLKELDQCKAMFVIIVQIIDRIVVKLDHSAAAFPSLRRYAVDDGEIATSMGKDRLIQCIHCLSTPSRNIGAHWVKIPI